MGKTLTRTSLLLILLHTSTCLAGEWFYGTWYFDRVVMSNEIPTELKPEFNRLENRLEGSIYEFSSNNVRLTVFGKVLNTSYKVVSIPNTNEVILKYESGSTNCFRFTNDLLEANGNGYAGVKFYYSRKKKSGAPDNALEPTPTH